MWSLLICHPMFQPRQKEGAIHREELVYELNPMGEWSLPQPPACGGHGAQGPTTAPLSP